MRPSQAVPGALAPVSREPRLLTDGLRGFRGRPGDSQGRPGDSRGMAVSLAAPTLPEAVRISGGCQGLIYLFLRLKNVVPTYVLIIGRVSSVPHVIGTHQSNCENKGPIEKLLEISKDFPHNRCIEKPSQRIFLIFCIYRQYSFHIKNVVKF